MAKGGDKRRVEANKEKLGYLLKAIVIADGLHLALRLARHFQSTSLRHYLGFALINALYYGCYTSLARMAVPTYGQGGEIVDGGADLTLSGLTGYSFDVIYLCILVQLVTIVSNWGWLIFLVVPAYGAYQLYINIIGPWLSSRSAAQTEGPETEEGRKRREKSEKRAQRRAGRYQ